MKAELLVPKVEIQVGECPSFTVEECRRLSPDDPVERRDSLLPVQQEAHNTRGKLLVSPVAGAVRPSSPDQQATDWVTAVQRVHERTYLVAVPDVAPLELRQRHVTAIDMVEDGRYLHEGVSPNQRVTTRGATDQGGSVEAKIRGLCQK